MKDNYAALKKELAKQKSLIFLDIETSPLLCYVWGLGEQHISHEQLIQESKVIMVQWMFEGDKKVNYLTWDKNHDDRQLLETFSLLMQDVKVAVSQNGKEFDHKILRWRLNLFNLPPLKNVEIIDILHLSRSSFRSPSHKLDYRSKVYGFGGKIPMKFKDWKDVMEDRPGALAKMIKYGCKDVPDLRSIFWKELPYYVSVPVSLSTLINPNNPKARDFCPRCASKHQRRFDVYPTKIGNKLMLKCEHCGHFWKDTRTVSKKVSQSLTK